ncbi:MAG: tryptophan synthase subunit alpha, partial [Candidatus Taylorbacteria bacterium]|nr:tryptophan synthase subunit alpha [Candidatus Taylorbacteria bacterium]
MNKLKKYLQEKKGKTCLMAHFVAGYPSLSSSLAVGRALVRGGASLLEIQIPFSDPSADGPVIVGACHTALLKRVSVSSVFKLSKTLSKESNVPIAIVSYVNPIYQYGISRFIEDASLSGVSAIIIPDLPVDTPEGKLFISYCKKFAVHPIILVSPGVPKKRLATILKSASGFVYCTSRQGTTGATSHFSNNLPSFVKQLRQYTTLPVAVGFGVRNQKDFKVCGSFADIVAVGSTF